MLDHQRQDSGLRIRMPETDPNNFALTSPITTEHHVYDVLLMDMSHLMHRITHAGGAKDATPYIDMMTSTGYPTGGVFGALKTLRHVLNITEMKVRDVMVIWDGRPRGLSERRVNIYPEYKNKPKSDEVDPEHERKMSFYEDQRPRIDHALSVLGIPVMNIPRREGDDVIACVSREFSSRGKKVLILSDDRDYYQLVTDQVHVYRAIQEQHITPLSFARHVKLPSPKQYLLYAALCGDSSDNITGIPGVGDGTAKDVSSSWIPGKFTFDSIKDAVEVAKALTPRNRNRYQKVVDGVDTLVRNLMLMDLSLEKLSTDETQYFWKVYNTPRGYSDEHVIRLFTMYEFRSLLENFAYWALPFRTLSKCLDA